MEALTWHGKRFQQLLTPHYCLPTHLSSEGRYWSLPSGEQNRQKQKANFFAEQGSTFPFSCQLLGEGRRIFLQEHLFRFKTAFLPRRGPKGTFPTYYMERRNFLKIFPESGHSGSEVYLISEGRQRNQRKPAKEAEGREDTGRNK